MFVLQGSLEYLNILSVPLGSVSIFFRNAMENYLIYFSGKSYVVGTQKNRLNETVLLSTKTHLLIDG